ncbi:flagellar hook-length control protein FliK [Cognatiyoonia sp. IB215446]|uniref:flagellar hook-length control protein FliK n=1 Tax=Cognatiyoonia sp. IB215446 TaxID=3097355 RepID=UPI002A0F8FCC|nr:flagellar hook-length control protein FliK [Cognatiyoonia sp. IB215446]MDX8346430.1 flagellar hook-length control protein FliK [Cognatiyoonia sp. IB215446]
MLPLPMTDLGAPPKGGPVDARASKSAQQPEQDGEALDFAATFALEADQAEKLVSAPEAELETPVPQVESEIPPEGPDIAIAETPKAVAEHSPSAVVEEGKRLMPRPDAEQTAPREELPGAKQAEVPRPAMAKGSAPATPPTMAQRVVEVQMPPTKVETAEAAKVLVAGQPKTPVAPAIDPSAKAPPADAMPQETTNMLGASKEATPKPTATTPIAMALPEEKSGVAVADELLPPKPEKRDIPVEARTPPKVAPLLIRETPMPVQATPLAQMMQDISKPGANAPLGDVELTQTLLVSERPAANASQQVVVTSSPHGAETTRQVAQQLVTSMTQHAGRMTEIALHPEELGRVRLAMTSLDAAITLSVTAERPETAELLRRNIDVLAQEFRDLGYDDINFSFDGDGKSDDGSAPEKMPDMNMASDKSEVPLRPKTGPTSGLDLRL